MIVKGLPEVKDEKMHVTMADLLRDLGCTFAYSATHGAWRIGHVSSGLTKTKSPRNIKLRLATKQQKLEMFGLKEKISAVDKYAHVKFT